MTSKNIAAILAYLLLLPPLTLSDDYSTDSMFVLIPGGRFTMGSTTGEKDERPEHLVVIDSFYLGKTEVTIGEYFECVRDGGCAMPSFWNRTFFDAAYETMSGEDWFNVPVVGVSWNDALDYCRWLDSSCTLPTEAQWEYAAKAGSSTRYPWGETADSISFLTSSGEYIKPVKSYPPNRFGVYDMIGNVWEWCYDRYDKTYYIHSPDSNPPGPRHSELPYRVVRGGSCNEYKWNFRPANRNYGEPFRKYNGVGFRICRNIH